jgi:hypothetical protein
MSQLKDMIHLHFKVHMSSELRLKPFHIFNTKNIIDLLGYCVQGEENILVYEYMPNKCLASIIAGKFTLTSMPLSSS